MRILFVIDGLRSGGKERRALSLLSSISKMEGIICELVLFNKDVHYKEVFDINVPLHFLIRKTNKDFKAFLQFYRICKNFNPDIIHAWDTLSTVYAIPACKFLGKKLISGKITDAPPKLKELSTFGLVTKFCFLFSNIILSNSYAGLKAYNAPKNKSKVIHNGISESRTKNLEEKGTVRNRFNICEQFIVAMVASFSKNKDYITYLEAAFNIIKKRKDIGFLCIGDGPQRAQLEKEYSSEKIYFLGRQSNVESIMNICDIGVLISNNAVHGEGISNAIMEFMLLGIPVLASNNGGNNELIENQVTGIILAENNPDLLSNTILEILNNKKRRNTIGSNAQLRIKNDFSLSAMIEEFLNIYKACLKD